MDLADSPDEARFRRDLRSWLAANAPRTLPDDDEQMHAVLVEWHRQLYRAGWIGLSWPVEYGGRGLGFAEESIFQEELGRADAPTPPAFGYIARALLIYGSEDQKRRYLPPLLRGDEEWCQGFSEPGAGSDLASLRTRAVATEAGYRISGQKIWTSRAMFADFCFLLARTEDSTPRHAGITVLIVPMDAPGIDVRPIREITGNRHHFAEVFFDDVEVGADAVLGKPNQGWAIATTTMAYERGPVDVGTQAQLTVLLNRIGQMAVASGQGRDPNVRRAIGQNAVLLEVLRLRAASALSRRMTGALPGPEGSVEKILMAQAEQQVLATAMDVLGPTASLDQDGWYRRYLQSRTSTIYGGAIHIQKNIVAQRVLGLPRS